MKTLKNSRLVVLTVSISAALMLSACQPANDAAETTDASTTTATTTENVAAADNAATDAHAGHDMTGGAMTAMHKEYNDSMTVMHDEMMVGMGYNDPDAAFAQGMLGHHIGAVDMAEIQLKYGTDAEMRQLAQEIIDAQKAEIEQMQNWIATHSS